MYSKSGSVAKILKKFPREGGQVSRCPQVAHCPSSGALPNFQKIENWRFSEKYEFKFIFFGKSPIFNFLKIGKSLTFGKSRFEIDILGPKRPKNHQDKQILLWTFQKIKFYWNPFTELGERWCRTLSLSGGSPPQTATFHTIELQMATLSCHVFMLAQS